MMSDNATPAEQWLDAEDRSCREDRLNRLAWLTSRLPVAQYWTFPGGLLAKSLFEEARYSLVYGQFLAAAVLGFAFVERTLAAMLFAAGRNDLEKANICKLLQEALDLGWISQEEFAALSHARKLRNALAHFRRPGHECSVEYRAISNSDHPYEIVEEDAKFIIEGGLRILRYNAA